jgi:hypothetical protein
LLSGYDTIRSHGGGGGGGRGRELVVGGSKINRKKNDKGKNSKCKSGRERVEEKRGR